MYDFDVAVIGSGAGGGTIAYALAQSGKSVILLERGSHPKAPETRDEIRTMIDMESYDDRSISFKNKQYRFYNGAVPGGSTALYGAALVRPAREDFTPGRFYGDNIPRAIWDWPISYENLEPFYDQAEALYGVCGENGRPLRAVSRPRNGYGYPVPPFKPINLKLAQSISHFGFSPYHLPLAINFEQCLHCPDCPGFLCPNFSRLSSWDVCIQPALKRCGLVFRTKTDVEKLLVNRKGDVHELAYKNCQDDQLKTISAKIIIVAAGAIGSAVVLLKSNLKFNNELLGRNYMFHAGALVGGLFRQDLGTRSTFVKQLAFSDLYFGSETFPHKMGYAQSVPTLGPYTFARKLGLPVSPNFSNIFLRRMLLFMGTVEDLPLVSNRIELNQKGDIRLLHKFHKYDLYRSKYYLKILKKIMQRAGAKVVVGVTSDKNIGHTAHQVGTARFGDDPATSVLDPMCRLHNYPNVFVVDGSFMPTSLGVSPALTIMANALRVADFINKEY